MDSAMEDEKDAFYIVRKGDIIGVYRSLSECQEQAGSSVSHPAMSVYKGYGWPKAAEDLISSFGIKNSLFSINASYVKDDMFGKLIPCTLQEPSSPDSPQGLEETSGIHYLPKRSHDTAMGNSGLIGYTPPEKHLKTGSGIVSEAIPSSYSTRPQMLNKDSCTIEFDGASKGNPGIAGAGAVLRDSDGSVLFLLREGVGIATNNAAEYRALILGLKVALKKGFRNVQVQGDSMLVCMQVQDKWKTKHAGMAELCKQVKELKRQFKSFEIRHIAREFNSDADQQANHAIRLADGQTEELSGE